jgi:hypothetical protein
MNKKELATYGIAMVVVQVLVSCGVFVTYPQMVAYAVSKDTMEIVLKKLDTIDTNVTLLLKER